MIEIFEDLEREFLSESSPDSLSFLSPKNSHTDDGLNTRNSKESMTGDKIMSDSSATNVCVCMTELPTKLFEMVVSKATLESEKKSYDEDVEICCDHAIDISDCVYCNDKEYDLVWNDQTRAYHWTESNSETEVEESDSDWERNSRIVSAISKKKSEDFHENL